MSNAEIFIYVIIAAFFAYRLWSVFGRTNGDEKARAAEISEFAEKIKVERNKNSAKAVILDAKPLEVKEEEVPSHLRTDVAEARRIDPTFVLSKFVEGAAGAFEMVIKAFAEGKKDALKFLLSADIYNNFEKEIDARKANEVTATSSIYSMQEPEVLDVEVRDNICQVVVRFVSEQFNYIRNKAGEIIEGSKSVPDHVTDVWTFERDLTSKKPNWVVVGIQSA